MTATQPIHFDDPILDELLSLFHPEPKALTAFKLTIEGDLQSCVTATFAATYLEGESVRKITEVLKLAKQAKLSAEGKLLADHGG